MIDWRDNATHDELLSYLKKSGGYVPGCESYPTEKLRDLVYEWDDFNEGDKFHKILG